MFIIITLILTAADAFWNNLLLNFILIVAGKDDTFENKSKRCDVDIKVDYDQYEVSPTHLGRFPLRGNEHYSTKLSILMMVLMMTLFFSGAHGCTSLPLACASQPPPPPPIACTPPPPAACPPPPPPTNEGFWAALLNVIRGWNRPMTVIIPVAITLLGGLGCCRYCRRRGHLEDVEDAISAISDI